MKTQRMEDIFEHTTPYCRLCHVCEAVLYIVATSSRQWQTISTRRYSSHRKSARASKEIASARAATIPAALATHSLPL
jgi:hypothetical protein